MSHIQIEAKTKHGAKDYFFKDVMKLTFVYDDKEYSDLLSIRKEVKDADISYFLYMKALCLNKRFESLIMMYRKKYNLPVGGIDYADRSSEEFKAKYGTNKEMFDPSMLKSDLCKGLDAYITDLIPYIGVFNRAPLYIMSDLSYLIENENRQYKDGMVMWDSFDQMVELLRSEAGIILNMFELYERQLFWIHSPNRSSLKMVFSISKGLSKTKLLKHINKNWHHIADLIAEEERYLTKFPWDGFNINVEHLRYVELRKLGNTYKEIIVTTEEEGQFDLDEDGVKQNCNRAEKKIYSLL